MSFTDGGGDFQRQMSIETIWAQRYSQLQTIMDREDIPFSTKMKRAARDIAAMPAPERYICMICMRCKKWQKDKDAANVCTCGDNKFISYPHYVQILYAFRKKSLHNKANINDPIQAGLMIWKASEQLEQTLFELVTSRISDMIKIARLGWKKWGNSNTGLLQAKFTEEESEEE